MRKLKRFLSVICIAIFFSACSLFKNSTSTTSNTTVKKISDDGKIELVILQINDVYEIATLSDGTGGMDRVAGLRKDLLKKYPNRVLTVLSGDFLNPSLIGTLKINGKGVKGQQMVEVMNALGVDYVCFGNHEFDLDMPDLQKRLDESNFKYVSANAQQKDSAGNLSPFKIRGNPIPKTATVSFTDEDGTNVNIGLFGVLLPSNPKDFVQYDNFLTSANDAVKTLTVQNTDAIFGITHLEIADDHRVAKANQNIPLILGGHEHSNNYEPEGNVLIAKADANAKTAYVHYISIDKNTHNTKVRSELVVIDSKIARDTAVSNLISKWVNLSNENFKKQGFDLENPVTILTTPLDGRESSIRVRQTNLGTLMSKSFAQVAKKKTDCAFFNGGSIRFDDQLNGKVTQLDIIRMLPFGGKLWEADITGAELQRALKVALIDNVGKGGYWQTDGIELVNSTDAKFKIGGENLDESKSYHIIFNDFLLSGKEGGLSFFNEKNPNITNIDKPKDSDATDLRSDLRLALIDYLKKM